MSNRRFVIQVESMSATLLSAKKFYSLQMEGVACMPFAAGQVAIFSRRAPDKPDDGSVENEDACAILPVSACCGVLAVADGCGGQFKGLEAAHRAIEALADCVMRTSNPEQLRGSILDGFEAASRSVAELGNGAATTMIAVEVGDNMIRTYHVGDSQAMLVGSRGKVKLQTRSHSPVGYAVEAGMLSEDDAIGHADRHIVSNVLGSPESHIDIGLPRPFSPRDTLVIGSDGLYDNLTQAEIAELVRRGSAEAAADATRLAVAQRMAGVDPSSPCKPDDLTFILYRADNRPPTSAGD
jgi:PPM family protein phosphatase